MIKGYHICGFAEPLSRILSDSIIVIKRLQKLEIVKLLILTATFFFLIREENTFQNVPLPPSSHVWSLAVNAGDGVRHSLGFLVAHCVLRADVRRQL